MKNLASYYNRKKFNIEIISIELLIIMLIVIKQNLFHLNKKSGKRKYKLV